MDFRQVLRIKYGFFFSFFVLQDDKIMATKQSMKEIGIAHAVVQTKGSSKFLVEDPFESVKKGNLATIPTIIGVTKDEGAMIMNGDFFFRF